MKTGKVSIIIPVRFRPDLTKVCLDSLFENTKDVPFELILIQEGDELGIRELLHDYGSKKIVYHHLPKGYPGAINAGYKLVANDSEFVCLLNSDTVCTPRWLSAMLDAFDLDRRVGLVGPTFSETGGVQNINYNKKDLDYSWVDEIKGVCMLFKKSLTDLLVKSGSKMGVQGGSLLDERFGFGGGDDNDVCMRTKILGYKTVIARKSFIYHYNSASFRALFDNDIPYSKKYSSGLFLKFKKKWQKQLGHPPRVYIAIPCFDGKINYELALRLIQWSHDREITIKIKAYPYLAPLDNARNWAVKDFLEDYWEYLFFIDNDIVPPVQTLRELLAANKDVIAPLCFNIKPDDKGLMFPYPVAHRYDKNGQYRPYFGKGIEMTDVVTGGAFLIKREVLEHKELQRPFFFTYHKNGLVEYSEDFVFSQQCQRAGFKLWTHYGLHCKHIKTIDIKDINDLLIWQQQKIVDTIRRR